MTRMSFSRRSALVAMGSAVVAPSAFAQVRDLNDAVNKAGRQRMLSQRMAKFQLALGWRASADASEQIATARREFIAALDVLGNAPEATPRIHEELDLARGQWILFDAALARAEKAGPRQASDVFVCSENILQVMDNIAGLYARLGA